MFVARYFNNVTTTVAEDKNFNNFIIYPNPADNKIEIETPQNSEVEVLNLEGQIIKSINTDRNNTTIDISGFSKGMYFVKVKTEKGIVVKKFIKE